MYAKEMKSYRAGGQDRFTFRIQYGCLQLMGAAIYVEQGKSCGLGWILYRSTIHEKDNAVAFIYP